MHHRLPCTKVVVVCSEGPTICLAGVLRICPQTGQIHLSPNDRKMIKSICPQNTPKSMCPQMVEKGSETIAPKWGVWGQMLFGPEKSGCNVLN
jgi:hypothetical protein